MVGNGVSTVNGRREEGTRANALDHIKEEKKNPPPTLPPHYGTRAPRPSAHTRNQQQKTYSEERSDRPAATTAQGPRRRFSNTHLA